MIKNIAYNQKELLEKAKSLPEGSVIIFDERRRLERSKIAIEFEAMRDMAELRALSELSLKRKPSNAEYNRMMQLKDKIFGGKVK